jgi:uncharacterized membrane protein YgaE (UPF0421/DUF939 family)
MVFTSIRAPRSPRLRSVATELRAELPAILQTIAAASLSYLAARYLPGRAGEPTFAPVAAIVAMTAAAGQRGRQAVLMVLGVAVGVSIANVLILVVGTGTWQLVVTMAVAMTAALSCASASWSWPRRGSGQSSSSACRCRISIRS